MDTTPYTPPVVNLNRAVADPFPRGNAASTQAPAQQPEPEAAEPEIDYGRPEAAPQLDATHEPEPYGYEPDEQDAPYEPERPTEALAVPYEPEETHEPVEALSPAPVAADETVEHVQAAQQTSPEVDEDDEDEDYKPQLYTGLRVDPFAALRAGLRYENDSQ